MFPFGKYKGQQISEVFKRDKKYVDWLVTTEWFTTRFIDLCKLSNHLISEHNRNIVYNDFITIYTDGACSRNGMEGAQCGIGIYFSERNPVHIGDVSERLKVDKPTNNIAELTAIKRSLDILIEKRLTGYTIKIYTDSQYSIDCVEKWYDMWIEKNNFNKRNVELIRDIYYKKKTIGFEFVYIKAHTNRYDEHSIGNSKADQLATNSLKSNIK
tara:strand:- start:739 stop:1377 length:639 start_codon:yes stop_codon:yes gene_type:complete